MGSPGAAAIIARGAFAVLLVVGVARGDLGSRSAAAFLALGLAALFGLPLLSWGAALVTPALAALDIALVLAVFKGDVRLT